LWYRDLFAFLPFQVSAHKFVIPVYVMTYDLVTALPGGSMRFRVTIKNINGLTSKVSLYDPISGRYVPAPVLRREKSSVVVGVRITDAPRLLTLSD
jgi:hypothetical protein